MGAGKNLRLQRFFYPRTTYGLIVPIDHGLTMGPLTGIRSVREMASWITHPAISGIIAHKGIAERLVSARLLDGKGLMIHLNGMTTLGSRPDDKVMLTAVETAMKLGADAVSLQVNFDGTNDSANLEMLGRVVDEASGSEIPVLAMVYDKVKARGEVSSSRIEHLMRVCVEMGCDAIKIGIPEMLNRTVRSASEDIRVFVAGGSVVEEEKIVDLARKVVRAGGSGLCVGRNVFQRKDTISVLNSLKKALTQANPKVAELAVEREAYGIN